VQRPRFSPGEPMIDARNFISFFNTKTGQITAFGILFFIATCLLAGGMYFHRQSSHGSSVTTSVAPKLDAAPQKPSTWFSDKPDADYANRHPTLFNYDSHANKTPPPPQELPISLFHEDSPQAEVSDTYAPYGR